MLLAGRKHSTGEKIDILTRPSHDSPCSDACYDTLRIKMIKGAFRTV